MERVYKYMYFATNSPDLVYYPLMHQSKMKLDWFYYTMPENEAEEDQVIKSETKSVLPCKSTWSPKNPRIGLPKKFINFADWTN